MLEIYENSKKDNETYYFSSCALSSLTKEINRCKKRKNGEALWLSAYLWLEEDEGESIWLEENGPNSLWVRTLKSLYFPSDNFLDSKMGYRAPWVWSSLLEGKEFLQKTLLWQVWNEESVRIWEDRWLVDCKERRSLIPEPIASSMPMRVVELMNKGEGSWDLSSIESWLTEEELKKGKMNIVGLRLSSSHVVDGRVWRVIWSLKVPRTFPRDTSKDLDSSDMIWKKPPESWIKINCDGAFDHKTKKCWDWCHL
ncbi:hypothetical protein GOBAR_DD06417 [Gossypium barbadense]|nr:hypothetical protein GOBAR_DD06417 [Gossypium barbadense]